MSTSTRGILRRIGPALFASGLCLATSAFADGLLPTITVEAPAITKSVVGQTAAGTPTEQVTVTHRVSYADLNLATHTGAAELKARVRQAAREACRQINDLYPMQRVNRAECIAQAVADSERQVHEAIDAAGTVGKTD